MPRKRTNEAESRESPRALAEAAKLIDVRPPGDELRAHVTARMETLAKLGAPASPGGSSAERVKLYAEALELGLRKLADAGGRTEPAGSREAVEELESEPPTDAHGSEGAEDAPLAEEAGS